MTDRPILFSSAMVRAILAGTKSQTRRVVSPQPPTECSVRTFVEESTDPRTDRSFAWYDQLPLPTRSHYVRCPFGHPGDQLWVRETWGLRSHTDTTDWNTSSVKGADDRILGHWALDYAADWGSNQENCHW